MGIAQLDNLVSIGKLKAEPPAAAELDGMVESGRARIADAEDRAQLRQQIRPGLQRRALRNRSEYEGHLDQDTKLLESLVKIVREVEKRVTALRKT
jgi:hypothetical protein